MSLPVVYGLTKLMPWDSTLEEKLNTLSAFAKMHPDERIFEVIQLYDEQGKKLPVRRMFKAEHGVVEEIDLAASEHWEEYIRIWENAYEQIDYDMWLSLDNVQVFLPGSDQEEIREVELPRVGTITTATMSDGTNNIRQQIEQTEGDEQMLWKQMLETFENALHHGFAVAISGR